MLCNMSKSMHMSRLEHRNTNNTESRVKNDLRSAWKNPRPPGLDAPLHSRRHRSKLHALEICPLHLVPTIDLSAHTSPVNTSFRQASADKPVLRAPHVLLDPKRSQPFKGEGGRVKGEGGEG